MDLVHQVMDFIHHVEDTIVWPFIEGMYATLGWWGVVVMMAIESACIPLPSEVILPLAGQELVRTDTGEVPFWGVMMAGFMGGLGCTIGSVITYWIGALGGRPLLEKYGKYVLISKHHIHVADKWFEKYGEATAFFSRLLPVVRTFISLPAGIARMNFPKFTIYTFVGSFIWSAALAWAGAVWPPKEIRAAMRPWDIPIILVILALVALFIFRSIRSRRQAKADQTSSGLA